MKRINQMLWLGLMTVLIMPACSEAGPFDPQENPLAQVPAPQTWYALTSNQPASPEIKFEGDEIIVTLPGFFYTTKTVNDKEYSRIIIPKHALLMNEGFPELPKVRFNMAIPKDAEANCELIDVDAMDLELKTPIPSRGAILRDVDPATVPYVEGEFYRGDKAFPGEEYHVDSTFVFRGAYGLPIEFYPIQYDPKEDLLRVYKTIRIKWSIDKDAYRAFAFKRTNQEFDEIFKETFANYSSTGERGSLSEPGRLIIIAADAFVDAVRPLAEWKIQRGLKTEIVKMSEIGTTADDIKSYITTQYQSPESLTYVVLVGDSDTIPTLFGSYEGAACDSCMAMVDGEDPYPDLFISRLSARTVEQVENQVNKFIRYEKNPDIDGAWYLRGIGVASDEDGGSGVLDWERVEELRIALEGYGFTEVAKIYDPGATQAELVAALNNGASVLNYDGHGYITEWGTTGFRYTSTSLLTNSYMNPFIVDVACLTGAFTSSSYPSCLAESFLQAGTKEKPAGAIAIYSASRRANWVSPTMMQKAVIKDFLVTNLKHTTGGLYFGGMVTALNEVGTTGYGLKLVEEYNIFGDASLSVRSKKPAVLDVTYPSVLPPTGPVEIEVFTQAPIERKPLFDATVALTYRGSILAVAQTNIEGAATLEYAPIELANPSDTVLLTVFAPNTVPVIETCGFLPPSLHAEPNTSPGLCNIISWDSAPQAKAYYAECAIDPCFSAIDNNSDWITSTGYEFCGLTSGQEYWYRVKSRGYSAWSQTSRAQFQSDALVDIMATSDGDVVLAVGDMLATDTLGNANSNDMYSQKTIVNVIECNENAFLTEIEMYLRIVSSQTLQFVVYETPSQSGGYATFNLIHSNLIVSGTGRGWFTSGPILVPLVEGKSYCIGVAWSGLSRYYCDLSAGLQDISWGRRVSGQMNPVYPAPNSVSVIAYTGTSYYQNLTTSGYSLSGSVVSTAINLPADSNWSVVQFDKTTPSDTTLLIDVLDAANDSVILADVISGTALRGTPATSIELRANLSTSDSSSTPALHDWSVAYTHPAGTESVWSNVVSSRQCGTPGDFEPDCDVGWDDLAVLVGQWLQPPWTPSADFAPLPEGDGTVNFLDFAEFAIHWLEGI